jgi:hypothetical protein
MKQKNKQFGSLSKTSVMFTKCGFGKFSLNFYTFSNNGFLEAENRSSQIHYRKIFSEADFERHVVHSKVYQKSFINK